MTVGYFDRFVKSSFACGAAILLMCSAKHVLGDSIRMPSSYTTLSRDKQFEFVMNVPGDEQADKRHSGLYRLHDDKPLWTVDWYANSVFVSSDGVHLIRRGPWASGIGSEAYSFFANGNLIRTYTVKDLLTTTEGLQPTASHIFWLESEHFDESKGLLEVTTLSKDKHVLRIVDGKVLHSENQSARQPPAGPVIDFGLNWKKIRLQQSQEIIGLKLPVGTEVRFGSVDGSIWSAVIHQDLIYRGIRLEAGSELGFVNRRSWAGPDSWRENDAKPPTDTYADMMVHALRQPSEWGLGLIRINGWVGLEENGETLSLRCSRCLYGSSEITVAIFDKNYQLKQLQTAYEKPLRIKLGADVLQSTFGATFWSSTRVRHLRLKTRQTFRGATVVGDLTFWSNGNVQTQTQLQGDQWDSKYYCKNGMPERITVYTKESNEGYLDVCDDRSIMYLNEDFICKHPYAARWRLPVLRYRPWGRFAECDSSTRFAIGSRDFRLVFDDIE